jgi:transcriptional regulator with XRE-family HTH domain
LNCDQEAAKAATLAERAGIHKNHLSLAEKGLGKLYLTTLEKLAAGLGVKASALL